MFDPERLLGQVIGGALGGAFGGKRGRKRSMFSTDNVAGKATLGLGLIGIAMAAYEHYKGDRSAPAQAPVSSSPPPPPPAAGATPPPPPPANPEAPVLPAVPEDVALLIRAMIAAAAADHAIDEAERARIVQRMGGDALEPEARDYLEQELAAPLSLTAIVAATRPEVAHDVYAASALAIEPDSGAERAYLDALAKALGLDDAKRREIDAGITQS